MKPTVTDLSVFVYGTLKPGGRYWPEFCEGKVACDPIAAKVRGELYDLHVGYPGMRLQGEGWVHGYLLNFETEEDFLHLDYLEGYDPERPYSENEYIRLKIPCYDREGQILGEIWAYEMTEATMARHQPSIIPGGNWPV